MWGIRFYFLLNVLDFHFVTFCKKASVTVLQTDILQKQSDILLRKSDIIHFLYLLMEQNIEKKVTILQLIFPIAIAVYVLYMY